MRVIILFLFSLILFSCKKEQTFTNGYSSGVWTGSWEDNLIYP